MFVVRSNRVEHLFDALAQTLETTEKDPFVTETIVVQNRGLATWLSLELARRTGLSAGIDYPFPRRLIDRLVSQILGPDRFDAYTPSNLLWNILTLLPASLEHSSFAELSRFIERDPAPKQRFQLAQRIARVFDQYAMFRPDVLLRWQEGQHDDWQARLWRSLVAKLGPRHLPALSRDLLSALHNGHIDPTLLPHQINIFGVSTLPPLFIELFAALGRVVPVHLYVVSPTQEFWAELPTEREALRETDHRGVTLSEIPPLLSSLGTVGREFQHTLETKAEHYQAIDLYIDPTPTMRAATLLEQLQADLLHLRRREPGSAAAPLPLQPNDRSLQLHSCHSPMREVEVLHDQLQAMFDDDPSLAPQDMLVMMSDVDVYAPLVEAVFQREGGPSIPFCVADRALRGASDTIEAFHRLLALVGGRVPASAILDLLALEPIVRRFEIPPEDLDVLRHWIRECGIRWGIDEGHRTEHGQPSFRENTWKFGLERMLLGYSLPNTGDTLFEGISPYDPIEGQQAQLLGQLAALCESLFAAVRSLDGPRPVAQWRDALIPMIHNTLSGDDSWSWDIQQLIQTIEMIADEAQAAGFEDEIDLASMQRLIDERIEDERSSRGFLAGGVTFSAMVPMRSVPFRVVCILGLSEHQYPRHDVAVSFDLIARHRRAGDRSRRHDDRYLFLEALLSARDRLQLYYVGQSVHDNSERPPSVVVTELLEHVNQAFVCTDSPGDGAVQSMLTVAHPMQPFSPRYYDPTQNPELFSYETAYVDGAIALTDPSQRLEKRLFLTEPLRASALDPDAPLSLESLVWFFRSPPAALIRRRLGVRLDEHIRTMQDREPMELDELERWSVGDQVLRHRLHGLDDDQTLALLRASGQLPLGSIGSATYKSIARKVDPIVRAVQDLRDSTALPPLEIDLFVGATRLVGTLHDRWENGTSSVQYARLSPHHRLAAWIHHLVLCIAAPADQHRTTALIARSDQHDEAATCIYPPVEDAYTYLQSLVELYRIGQTEPLLLFPKTSWAFVQAFIKDQDHRAALEQARRQWRDHFRPWLGEANDPYIRRLFGDDDIFDPNYRLFEGYATQSGHFMELAIRVFEPLLRHSKDS